MQTQIMQIKYIWHTNDTPQQNRKILFETNSEYGTLLGAYTIEGYCSFDEETMPFGEEDVLRWCYIEDLMQVGTKHDKLIRHLLKKYKKYFTLKHKGVSRKEVVGLVGTILRHYFSEDDVREQIELMQQGEDKNEKCDTWYKRLHERHMA